MTSILPTSRKAILFFFFLTMTLFSFAQHDSVPEQPTTITEIYDVVAIYKQHTDGRGNTRQYVSELKGEIINYDEGTGVLTFKAVDGKMYSLKSSDYKYFEYDKEFTKKIKQVVTKTRKESGYEFSVGIAAGYFNINHDFKEDGYFSNGFYSSADIPITIRLGASRYLNKNMQVGLVGEYALLIGDSKYFNLGARFQYMYNPSKNTAFYLPVEVKYSRYEFDSQYQVNDTTFIDEFSWEYPSRLDTRAVLNNVELCIGQGISFALKNNKSLNLEAMFVKQFTVSQAIRSENALTPNSKFNVFGGRLSLSFNF